MVGIRATGVPLFLRAPPEDLAKRRFTFGFLQLTALLYLQQENFSMLPESSLSGSIGMVFVFRGELLDNVGD